MASRLLHRERVRPEIAVSIVYVSALVMNLLDTTIVNVSLPTLSKDFSVTESTIEWVITGYLLSLAVWIPASGWIGDRFGARPTFLTALGIFTLASALCGLATSPLELIMFRVFQGIGGGMLTPVGFAMLYRSYPPEKRATVAKVLMIPTACAPACGPIIGGIMVDWLSWRWGFFINVPVGILALAFGYVFLRDYKEENPGSFDLPGFVLAGAGLAMILYALSQGASHGWTAWDVVLTGVVSVICLVSFVVLELRRREPMLRLVLLKERMFRSTLIVSLFALATWQGFLFVMPLFLQTARGESAIQSGLTTFPEAVGVLIGSQFSARFYKSIGPRRLITGGLFVVTILMLGSLLLNGNSSLWIIRFQILLMGFSMSFALIPMQVSALANIPKEETGQASAILNTCRRVAVALGVAILATVLTLAQPVGGLSASSASLVHAFHYVFAAGALITFLGMLAALTMRDEDAAATRATAPEPKPQVMNAAPAALPADAG